MTTVYSRIPLISESQYAVSVVFFYFLKVAKGLSLVEFHPATGRMHQLRFHSKLLKCPIVGDEKYGGKKHVRMMAMLWA